MRFVVLLSIFVCFNLSIFAQTDTVKKIEEDTAKVKLDKSKNPTIALTLSAILPGSGQVYNNKYYKLPIIYGGFAAIAYYFRKANWAYRAYRNDILLMQNDSIPESLKFPTTGIDNIEELAQEYNKARRKRDLFFLGGIVLWTLNIVDAYVDAELSNFDVSEDLSLNINPYYNNFSQYPAYGITFQFYFK